MTAELVAWFVLAVAGIGAAVTALIIAARWMLARVDRDADVTRFADAVTAENEDVLAQEAAAYSDAREALSDEMVALLTEAIADVEALVEAADLVDALEGLEAQLDDMRAQVNRVDRAAAA